MDFESKEQACVRFKDLFRGQSALVNNVDCNALPASLRVKLSEPEKFAQVTAILGCETQDVDGTSKLVCAQPGIDNVVAGNLAAAAAPKAAGKTFNVAAGKSYSLLDLMEEFRPFADRLALSLVNRGQIKAGDFIEREGGAVSLEGDARKAVVIAFQERKQETVHFNSGDPNHRGRKYPRTRRVGLD